MDRISNHISFEEATKSPTAIRHSIDNIPSEEVILRMKDVANACFEPVRDWYNKPIKINSFYRCDLLNAQEGGAYNSQHVKGEAIDMDAGSKEENKKIFDWCKDNLLFDQLINEYDYSWVHISFKKGNNRNQKLTIK